MADPSNILDSTFDPDETPPETPPVNPDITPETPPETPSLLGMFKSKFGEELEYSSDDEILEDIGLILNSQPSEEEQQRIDRLGKLEPLVNEYLTDREKFQAWQEQQADTTTEPARAESGRDSAPEVSEMAEWLANQGKLPLDNKGFFTDGGDPNARPFSDQLNKRELYRRRHGQALMDDSFGTVMKDGLESHLSEFQKSVIEEATKIVDQKLSSFGITNQLHQVQQKVYEGLYELDESGNILNGSDGNPRPSARGNAFFKAQQQAAKLIGVELESASPEQKLQIIQFAGEFADSVSQAEVKTLPETSREATPAEKRAAKQKTVSEAARTNGKSRLNSPGMSVAQAAQVTVPESDNRLDDLWDSAMEAG